jgi:hypothetical protein
MDFTTLLSWESTIAFYAILLLSIEILSFSIASIMTYIKNKTPLDIYYYLMIFFLILSVLSILTCIYGYYYPLNRDLILTIYIGLILLSFWTLAYSIPVLGYHGGTVVGYILTWTITIIQLGVMAWLIYIE